MIHTLAMTFPDWRTLRNHLIELYGETPHPVTEQEIIDAYELHPDQITKTALAVATDVQAGTARSGWAVLKTRSSSIATPPANPSADTGREREKRIAHAEQWQRAAGLHFDNDQEILDELFGDRGQLRAYAQVDLERQDDGSWQQTAVRGDIALAARIAKLWQELRPTGEQIEADADERAAQWKTQQAARQEALAQAKAELEAKLALPEPEYALVGQTPPPDETLYDPKEETP